MKIENAGGFEEREEVRFDKMAKASEDAESGRVGKLEAFNGFEILTRTSDK